MKKKIRLRQKNYKLEKPIHFANSCFYIIENWVKKIEFSML